MDTPLGRAAGNWLEIRETVACLSGSGPSDLREMVLACAAHLLVQTGRQPNLTAATEAAATCLDSGAPLARWNDLLAAQGADLARYASMLCAEALAPAIGVVRAPLTGVVSRADSRILGEVIRDLGGGRLRQDSVIDPHVGIDQLVKPGEPIRAGEPLCRIHARTAPSLDHALTTASAAFQISETPEPVSPRVHEVILPTNPSRTRAEE